jgi:predicted  nucleic acid-binding Zn-ribbon protein
MSHLEHPGPEAPANQGSKSSSKTQSGESGSSGSGDKGRPAIHQPKSAAEKDDPEVRKHNEDMKQRSEKSTNQLSEDDNKVNPNFWKGQCIHVACGTY